MKPTAVPARPEDVVPPFTGNVSFNAQHSPVGAFMSFTCGHAGTGGGIGAEIGTPANQNLFVGLKEGARREKAAIRCLPFLKTAAAAPRPGQTAADYAVEQAAAHAGPDGGRVQALAAEDVRRHYGWGTDTWVAPGLSFALHTPFAPLPEPGTDPDGLREALLPAVVATLRVDNRQGAGPVTAFFAIEFPQAGARLLASDSDPAGIEPPRPPRLGFAWRRSMGVLATLEGPGASGGDAGLFAFQRWSLPDGLEDANPAHALGNCPGIGVEVPAGEARTIVLAIGVYLDGVVTTGLEGKYYYTRFYGGLEHVLSVTLDRADSLRRRAAVLDRKLLNSRLSPDQQFLVAHGTRSYYGSTQLLDVGGEPFWVVNEGEYCMMNTLDLSVDQGFWELEHNPWVVRNLLDNFARHYSFADQLKVPGKGTVPGGLSFTHDMGVHNNFSPRGTSSYELQNLTGCFSHMTQEQLCNWVLLAGCYVANTRDVAWARSSAHLLRACLRSLDARRGSAPGGFMRFDSARCGPGGAEITTYDSLDESLGQARSNLYIGVKRWASYAALRMIDELAGLGGDVARAAAAEMAAFAEKLSALVAEHGDVLPAVVEPENPGFQSRILSACEALVYPWYWNTCGYPFDFAAPECRPVVEAMRRHTAALLNDPQRRNLFADGGIKLSSTSSNSWMSKIALFQHVCRAVLEACADARVQRLFAAADAAHVRWQTDGGGYWACSDQFVSGRAAASRYYPRVITAALWLTEPAPPELPAGKSPVKPGAGVT